MPPPLDFHAIFEATANPYMLLDRDLRYVAANRAYLEVTASRFEDLVGRCIFDAFPNDRDDRENRSAQVLRQSLEKVLRTRRRDVIAFLPYRVARVAGGELEERFWSATHTPLLDDAGEVAFILQHTVDVTELHRWQRVAHTLGVDLANGGGVVESDVLRRAQAVQDSYLALDLEMTRLRQMFDQTPGFTVFLRGPEHVVELANRAYEQLVGRGNLLGKPVRDALPELAGQGFYELLDRVYATAEPFVGRAMPVTLARAASGEREEVFVDFVYQPIVGVNGHTLGILVQGNDVTETRRNEVRQRFVARASEQLAMASEGVEPVLERIAAAAVDGFADWCIIDLFDEGRGTRRMAHAANPELRTLAAQAQTFAPPPDAIAEHPTLGGARTPTLMTDFTDEMAVRLARSPEHLAWLRAMGIRSLVGLPLIARGRRLGVLSFLATQRRFDSGDLATAEELARMASTVIENAQLSRERDELLVREQSRARARRSGEPGEGRVPGHARPRAAQSAVADLDGGAAAQAARRSRVVARADHHRAAGAAPHPSRRRSARRLTHHPRQGRAQEEPCRHRRPSSPPPSRWPARCSSSEQHRLHVDVVAQTLFVDGDAVRLGQVVANLLTNAARYTLTGGDIRVSARADGGDVVVRVRDNGIGIAPELLPRIFDMFVQGPQRSERAEGGLGLGLTLVRTLVQMHGGSVEARSDGIGRGSEFVVRLPRLAEHAAERPRRVPTALPAPAADACSVLVVDDNVDAAQLLSDLLQLEGYTTTLAHDGPSALAAVASNVPDVAILDIGLPVMDGYELAAQLRSTLGAETPQLIALTGYGQEGDRQRSESAGFIAHLVKPVPAEALLRTLASVCDGRTRTCEAG